MLLFAFFLASMHLVEFTDSTAFCSTCHNMDPEVTVYHASPHARTDCGTCHVGPGALAFVQAKLQNVRYLWIYPLNLYPRPIPSPIESLRPVEVVCEQCHWPQKFYEDRLLTVSDYASDEKNSLTHTNLLSEDGRWQRDGGARAAASTGTSKTRSTTLPPTRSARRSRGFRLSSTAR